MRCRIALAFGMLPSEALSLPVSEYRMLEMYWEEEPWGPWRDNLHVGIVAREVLRAGGFKVPKIDVFMLKKPPTAEAAKAAGRGLMDMFKTIAVRKKKPKPKQEVKQ